MAILIKLLMRISSREIEMRMSSISPLILSSENLSLFCVFFFVMIFAQST